MTSTPIFHGKVECKDIKSWADTIFSERNLVNDERIPKHNYHNKAVFQIDKEINSKISIWLGDLISINSDVIVYSDSSSIIERSEGDNQSISEKIFKYGGSEMLSDYKRMNGDLRYGESIITTGGNLPCRYVIHTVCPTYNNKYLSAAENALNSCYRSAFHLAMDNIESSGKPKTISFSCLHSEKKSFPSAIGVSIALRTVRKFMEKQYSNSFEKVILVIDSIEDMELYESMLPLYFPRNQQELLFSIQSLPEDIGDENGESIEEERKIRIIETPSTILREPQDESCFYDEEEEEDYNNGANFGNGSVNVNIVNNNKNKNVNNKLGSDKNKDFLKSIDNDIEKQQNYKYDEIDRLLNPFSSGSPGVIDGNSFTLKKEDPDIEKRRQFSKKSEKEIENEFLQYQFQILLTRSKVEDLSEVSRLNFTLQTTDDQNKPIVVIIGSQLNSRRDLYDKVILYLIRVLEQTIQRGNFSVIYFHSNMSTQQSWLKKLLEIFELKYKDNLTEFNIVHPTFLLKTTIYVSKSILSGPKSVLSKIVYHDNMKKVAPKLRKCNLPKTIFAYEISKNEIDDFSFSFDNDVTL